MQDSEAVSIRHHWPGAQTIRLLNAVMDATAGDIILYQAPTKAVFFQKILDKYPEEFVGVTYQHCAHKMRNLRSSYTRILDWLKATGSGLLAHGDSDSVEAYIHKKCEYYDWLDDIFGQKQSVNPTQVVETSTSSSDSLISNLQNSSYTDEQYLEEALDTNDGNKENGNLNEQNESLSEQGAGSSIDVVSAPDTSSNPKKPLQARKRSHNESLTNNSDKPAKRFRLDSSSIQEKNKPKNVRSGSVSGLITLQTQRLEFDEMKFEKEMALKESEVELDKIKSQNLIVIKKMELEQSLEIRKLEIAKEERVELAKAKMQLDFIADLKKLTN